MNTVDANFKQAKKISLNQWILTIVLSLGSFVMIVPFLWMLVTSFDWAARLHINFPPRLWPEEPSIKTFEAAFTSIKMFRYISNSILVSVSVIIVSALSALLSGTRYPSCVSRGEHRAAACLEHDDDPF